VLQTLRLGCCLLLLIVFLLGTGATAAGLAQAPSRKPSPAPTPRRPLPKPTTGSRGFEQAGKDASSRLIAAGATRGPLKPSAPYEGLAFSAQPFFAWTPSPGAVSYHLTLREGFESSAPVTYEADVNEAQLIYPAKAPKLVPGKLYTWRVSIAGVMERKHGPPVTFFVLAGQDAEQVKKALAQAKLNAPKTAADRLRQARIFEEYGVWYDALRIASELIKENPDDAGAKSFYDSLIQRLQEQTASAASQSHSLALTLWLEVRPLVESPNETAARAAITRNPAGTWLLYRNLLFESVTSRLYGNPTLPSSDRVRKLLVESDGENQRLETKFDEWSKEKKPGVGFTNTGDEIEQLLYLAQVANIRGSDKDPGKEAPQGSPRELIQRALELAQANGIELAIAGLSGTLSYYALREARMNEFHAPLDRAQEIWTRWGHAIGLAQVPLIRGYAAFNTGNWKEAAEFFVQAAELAQVVPELRAQRVNALTLLATASRNLDDIDGAAEALLLAVNEQQQVVKETTESQVHLKQSKLLAGLETQYGGALASLGRHAEAGEWYVRAEQLRDENYRIERASIEKNIVESTAMFQARIDATSDAELRPILAQTLASYIDGQLSYLDSLATARDDLAENARIANERLALARRVGDPDKIAHGLQQVANAFRKAGELAKAKAAAEEALTLRTNDPRRRWLYETLNLLAQIADDADDWDEALIRYRQVVEQTRPGVLPSIYDLNGEQDAELRTLKFHMNSFDLVSRANKALEARTAIANLLSKQGNYREADQEYQAVLNDVPLLFAYGAPDEAELLKWIRAQGDAQFRSADVVTHRRQTGFQPDSGEQQRLGYAELAIDSHRAVITGYRASLYENQNDLENAAKAYRLANTLNANLTGGSFALSGTFVALARIERERGNYSAAEPAIETALAEAIRKNDAWGIANMLIFKSALRRDQGRLVESKQLAEDALNLSRPLGLRSQVAGILRTLGRTETELGGENLAASEQHLREALAIWREMGLRAHTAYTLDSLGLTLERLGRDDQALAAYTEAVGIIETLVGSLSKDVSSETFNASRGNRDLYDHLIKLLIRQGRAAEALQYLERAKSKSLVDALAGSNVNARDPALQALLDRVRTLADSVREADTALATEMQKPVEQRDPAVVAAAQARAGASQRQYLDAVNQIQRTNPSYASLVAVNPVDLVEARKRLEPKTLLLEYFPTDDELYIFVVTRTAGPMIRTVPIKRADLAKLVMQFREGLSSATEQSVLSRSARGELWKDDGKPDFKTDIAPTKDAIVRLYDALIAPVQAEVDSSDRILIVPAGELYYLPFNALGKANPDGTLSFLIEKKSFAYFASADLLNAIAVTANVRNSAHGNSTSTLLALGNPDGTLPAASTEVSQLGRLFIGSSVFTGKDATVERVTTGGAKASYLHFATHGFINSLEPKESYLLLAGKPGRLSVKDLIEDNYKLTFSGTRLVTLSACETNIGGYDPSAVYSSLSRAFSKAGAPTVVASLWSVNDVSTRETMTTFYKQLAAGQLKAEALRRAQIATMRDPRFAHPYYWSAFIILGDWR
jgi:CHAT domain-containing protein